MAIVQTQMSSKEMDDLATEITKTYMENKTMCCDETDFINTFLDFRDVARIIIEQRELAKRNSLDDYSDCAKRNR